jgi:hypothetical protein
MKTKRSLWPYAIILYFVIFITAMTAWIVFAVRNDQQLVRADYYEQELKFQNEIDRSARTAGLDVKLAYDSTKGTLAIQLPTAPSTGVIYFYRPANAKLDREISLSKEAAQQIDLRAFERGLWKIRLSWTANGSEYRRDEKLFL